MEYDLEKRTSDFSVAVVLCMKEIGENIYNRNIIAQLLRSSTSVGANYREANGASSKKDFRNKIHISKKEIKETKYWIELLAKIEDKHREGLRDLWKEAHELTCIFGKISSTLQKK